MQQLNQLLNVKNLPLDRSPDTPLPTNSNEKQGPKWKLYVASMTRVVLKTVNLANAPALTETELGLRVKDWSDYLWPHVPEERLAECFDYAAERHAGGFPLSAYEIRTAWNAIKARDAEQIITERETAKAERPIEHCSVKDRHINDLGEIDILYGGPGGIEANVPCPICQPEANGEAYAKLAQRLSDKMANRPKSNVLKIATGADTK